RTSSFAMSQWLAGKGGSVREAGDAVQFDEISRVLIGCLNFGRWLRLRDVRRLWRQDWRKARALRAIGLRTRSAGGGRFRRRSPGCGAGDQGSCAQLSISPALNGPSFCLTMRPCASINTLYGSSPWVLPSLTLASAGPGVSSTIG